MKHSQNTSRIVSFAAGALCCCLSACNGGDDQLPPGTRVSISPSSYTWTVTENLDEQGNCEISQDRYQDMIAYITVTDSSGRPIGEADLQLYLSPSNSTSPPQWNNRYIFYLYDDFNGNGVVDHPQELVSGTGEPILYETNTEKYHGTKIMIVRTNTSCGGFLGTLHAYAGDGSATMEISTQAEQLDEQ
ncbi:MAG: hypothetical protein P8179_13855 [Candidatus Thiodiazotropha sp.]|jgi:hypothetical protein